MKSRKKSWLALVLCAMVISIAACGGGEDDDKSGGKDNDRDKRPVAEESSNKLQTSSGRDSAYVKELDGTWKFGGKALAADAALKADYSSWKDVTIPHTWNEKDAEDGGGNYERTAYWYHKEFQVEENIEGKRIYVEFLGSNTRTEIYINGEKAGDEHKGGYTAFRYDITDYVKSGTNVMDVKTDNTVNQEIAPISGDFNMYGGIYRRVYLVTVNDVHISLDEDGSSGLFLTTGNMRSKEAPKDLGEFQVKTDFVNSSDKEKTVEAVITVKGDNAPEPITEKVTVPAGGTYELVKAVKVENPTLWEGISYERDGDNAKAGYQYVVTVELKEGGKVIDKVEDKLGFRYFWIDSKDNGDAGEGFFLNGKAYPLRGVNRHSYLAGVGSAMTEEQHRADMDIMLELGVNTVRLCHYPQTDYFYDLCDDKGIVVWTEIPLVNMIGSAAGFEDNVSKQLTELIKQQYNRPSVVFWGLENEIGNGTDLTNATANSNVAKMKKLIYNLDNLARELDTTGRYTTQAVNRDYSMDNNNPDSVNKDFENNKGWKSDTVAWNIYPGWYPDANFYGTFEDVMKRKTALDSRPMGISEYGWGANVNQHEAYPALGVNNLTSGGAWHPEEYQNIMNEEALEYINNHRELWGTYYWVMFDFAVDARNEGSQTALNDKGLVTADRSVKKDSFYLYKANWNKRDAFVYITSRRWTEREDADTYIKVYSNCDKVELFINGKSIGMMEEKGDGVFILEDVTLDIGKAEIKAVGTREGDSKEYTDGCTWTRSMSDKAELKSDKFTVDTTGKVVFVDKQVTLKEFKELVSGAGNAVYNVYKGDAELKNDADLVGPGVTVKVVAEDEKTTSEYKIMLKNICTGKDVTVSSFEAGNIGENAVDGDAATRWVAVDGTYPQSITVDLGEAYYVGNLTMQWDTKGGNRHYMYYVEVSEDGTNFREVLDKRSNTAMGTITDSLNMAKARYIRITATGCNVTGWATLFEIQADGYSITSEKYKIDNDNKLIILDEIPDAGLAEGVFMDNLSIKGNYSYTVNLSSGWINDGNTVDIIDLEGNKTATYRICTEDTK